MTQALKDIIINALEEVKATEITTIDVRDLTGITDTMVVASGNSNRQVQALANGLVVDATGFWRCLMMAWWLVLPGSGTCRC